MFSPRDMLAVMVKARGNILECDQSFILADRKPLDKQICALTTIGQYIDINTIMSWHEVCFLPSCIKLTFPPVSSKVISGRVGNEVFRSRFLGAVVQFTRVVKLWHLTSR